MSPTIFYIKKVTLKNKEKSINFAYSFNAYYNFLLLPEFADELTYMETITKMYKLGI